MNSHQWSWTLLRAGAFRLDGGSMFGIIPRTFWSKWAEADDRNRIPLQTNCLLLDDGTRKVLVETGCGNKWSEKERSIYAIEDRTVRQALAEVDVSPEEISAVIVTHLHFDHAGGLTENGDGDAPQPVFPSADIFIQRQEWEDAVANRSTMSRTYLRSHLDPIRDRVRPIDGIEEVLPGLRVEPLPGHTWGMQGVFFEDTEGTVVFPGDLMPTQAHVHPAASMAYDVLPFTTMESKAEFLARAHGEGWRIVLDHEPGPAVVRARSSEEGRYSLHPVESD
ncbi:MAG: MBL fold metallo-hydrolase [Phycisphaerales bacterium]|nr:MBL fold metallo-hydrolase [Phycisphaerales bacterium]